MTAGVRLRVEELGGRRRGVHLEAHLRRIARLRRLAAKTGTAGHDEPEAVNTLPRQVGGDRRLQIGILAE